MDPWKTEIPKDYEETMKEFGLSSIPEELIEKIPDNLLFKRKIIFAHRDLDKIIQAHEQGKDFAVLTGIKPSSNLHLGNLLVIKQMLSFQKMRAKIYYAVADIEAYHSNNQSLEKSHEIAIDNIADLLALGIKEDNYFYKQSQEIQVLRDGYLFSKNVTMNMIKAIYGEHGFGYYMSALLQIGDIFIPQSKKFGGPKPVIVPVGLDQDPHIRLARDLAPKNKLIPPAATYSKLLPSLTGEEKMSKSNPLGMISLSDSPEQAEKKVMNAFTGGRESIEQQRKLGGQPEKCRIYDLYLMFFEEDEKKLTERYEACKSGKLLCGECKKQLAERIKAFLKKHQEKKEKLYSKAEELLS